MEKWHHMSVIKRLQFVDMERADVTQYQIEVTKKKAGVAECRINTQRINTQHNYKYNIGVSIFFLN